jgi:hypothetical protein
MENRFGNENRINLPRVLEAVHRKNALLTLGELGIKLAEKPSWRIMHEVYDKVTGKVDGKHAIASAEYRGLVPVRGIFGVNDWRLVNSGPTGYSSVVYGKTHEGYDEMHKMSEINVRNERDAVKILLIPDSAPVAIHEADINHVLEHSPKLRERKTQSDAAILEAVQRSFGDNAVDFISDTAAKSLAFALANDESRPALSSS